MGIGVGLNLTGLRWPFGLRAGAGPEAPGTAAEDIQRAFVGVADHLRPAVVNIATAHFLRRQRPRGGRAAGGRRASRTTSISTSARCRPGSGSARGSGSGVIIDAQGHILTNLHVIKGADEITVRFHNKKEVPGKIVGTDADDRPGRHPDPARARAWSPRSSATPTASRSASGPSRSGAPSGSSRRVTVGVVSATGRSEVGIVPNENFIQTDASINPGNSGGPLLNALGEVIGINTAILSSGQGIGFAIPINTAQRVASALIARGRVQRGWLGVALEPMSDDLAQALGAPKGKGAVVKRVLPGGPAEKAGIQPERRHRALRRDDRGQDLTASPAPGAGRSGRAPGQLRVLRQGKEVQVSVTISEAPAERPGAS